MKRVLFFVGMMVMALGVVWAQLGNQPSGFDRYRSDELELTFFYPNDWFVSAQEGNLMVANREALLQETGDEMPDIQPGDTAMVIGIMPVFFMAMMGIPTDDISTILDGMFDNVVSSNEGSLENSSKEILEYGDRSVATVTFDDASQEASGIFLVSHEQEEVIMFAVAYGFRSSLDRNRNDLGRVVASAEFTGDLESMMQQ
jgi:hypothetical protein